MEFEIWKSVVGYEGYYDVSNFGRVRSVDRFVLARAGKLKRIRGKLCKQHNTVGRLTVNLSKDNKVKSFYVHRLVLEAFVGPCPEGMECCHFPDRDPSNNKLENLRWDTSKANSKDMLVHGTRMVGEYHPCSKLNKEAISDILKRLELGEKQSDLACEYGVSSAAIIDIRKRITWLDDFKSTSMPKLKPGVSGVRNGNSKLSDDQIQEIRKLRMDGESYAAIAAIFQISRTHVGRIIKMESR